MMRLSRMVLIWVAFGIAADGVVASGSETDYLAIIKPLLQERCYACHGALKQEAGLRLDTGAAIRHGGDSGPSVASNGTEGELERRIASADLSERMPPEGEPLSAEQIVAIRRWIAQGAASPADEQPEADPRSHWAFQKPRRPQVPLVLNADGSPVAGGNEIDAFLAAKWVEQGLSPRPLAGKAVWLRRVHLDLIGLPPTPEELQGFLADESPEAYHRVVDRLLDSPQYGERWGRHWMDIWRYSDWFGRRYVPDVWNSAPQIWRWRDWIVDSLNRDRGYDQMVREMLAADEVAPGSTEAAVATGYLIRNWYALNPNDWMRSTVEHTGKAFLGLTFNCAHCHDHKYDPISQEDYFRLRAFFEPIYIRQDRLPGEPDPGPFQDYAYSTLRKVQRLGTVRVFDKQPEAPTWFYTGGDERNRVTDRGSIPPGVPEFLAGGQQPEIRPIELPPVAWYPALAPEIRDTILADATQALHVATTELAGLPGDASSPEDTTSPPDPVAVAQTAYDRAVEAAVAGQRVRVLSGQQSLLFDALNGRRILHHRLAGIPPIEDRFSITFRVELLTDTHFNFQLAKDIDQGLTAGYLGFEAGRILAYQPGSFSEFEIGKYDFAAGERAFEVQLRLEPSADRMLATVRLLNVPQAENGTTPESSIRVSEVPIAINGWNPADNPPMGISFDARAGSRAAVDDWVLWKQPQASGGDPVAGIAPGGTELIRFDFESPAYADRVEVVGQHGWESSRISQPPASSRVVRYLADQELDRLAAEVETHRIARERMQLPREAALAKVAAAEAALAAIEARIAADRVRQGGEPGDGDQLARQAEAAERASGLKQATAELLKAKLSLATASAQAPDEAKRAEAIQAAGQAVAAAIDRLAQAQAAITAPPTGQYTPLGPAYPKTSTGRRRALAQWITSTDNPLTARVAVNHVWTRHFHAPLVTSVYDFGRSGAQPTHPELLDWLAVRWMESGWSMKHLHRLIVTSDAYRRESRRGGSDSPQSVIDPENRWLWRMNAGRMEAETLRDSLLYLAGKLDLTPGGQEWENTETLTTYRRSLYYAVYPEDGGKSPLGQLFDGPDAMECYRRTRSIIPQQALALTNSDWVHQVSAAIVATWQRDDEKLAGSVPGSDAEVLDVANARFIDAMFERILNRGPSAEERAICLDAIRVSSAAPASSTDSADPAVPAGGGDAETVAEEAEPAALDGPLADRLRKGRESLVRALLNHNDMITIR
jgi:hypothetical protein